MWVTQCHCAGGLSREVQSEARLYNFFVEINKDHPDEDKDVLHAELATAREAAALMYVWQRLPDRPGTGGSPRVAKREGSDTLFSLEGSLGHHSDGNSVLRTAARPPRHTPERPLL